MKSLILFIALFCIIAHNGLSQYRIRGYITFTETNGPTTKNYGVVINTNNHEGFVFNKTSTSNTTTILVDTLAQYPIIYIGISESNVYITHLSPNLNYSMGIMDTTITQTFTYNNDTRTIKIKYSLRSELYQIKPLGSTISCGNDLKFCLTHSPYKTMYELQAKLKSDTTWLPLKTSTYANTPDTIFYISSEAFPEHFYNKEIQIRIKYYPPYYEVCSYPLSGVYFLKPSKTKITFTPPTCHSSTNASFSITPPPVDGIDTLNYAITLKKYTKIPTKANWDYEYNGIKYYIKDGCTLETSIPNNGSLILNTDNLRDKYKLAKFDIGEGLYRCEVKPNNGNAKSLCTVTLDTIITAPDPITISDLTPKTIINVAGVDYHISTYGGTGTANLSIKGRADNEYTIASTPPGLSLSHVKDSEFLISGIPNGTHKFTIQYGTCSSTEDSVTLKQPDAALSLTANTVTHVNCNSDSTGTIPFTISGGLPPYNVYRLNNDQKKDSLATSTLIAEFENVPAGEYQIMVSDAVGNTFKTPSNTPIKVNEPVTVVSVTCTTSKITWPGVNDGQVVLHAKGGTKDYKFQQDEKTVQLDSVFNVGVINSVFKAIDANGCTAKTAPIALSNPDPITIYTSDTPPTCNLSDGSLTVTIQGGRPTELNYFVKLLDGTQEKETKTISKTDNSRSVSFSGIGKGINYAVRVYLNANNPVIKTGIEVKMNNPLTGSFNITPASCYSVADGKAKWNLNNLSSSPILKFDTQNQAFDPVSRTFSGLIQKKTYSVSVTDERGCTLEQDIKIPINNDSLRISGEIADITACEMINTGGIGVWIAKGDISGGYRYKIDGQIFDGATVSENVYSSYQTNTNYLYRDSLWRGSYQFSVQDKTGCTVKSNDLIVEADANPFSNLSTNDFSWTNESCQSSTNGTITIQNLPQFTAQQLKIYLDDKIDTSYHGTKTHNFKKLTAREYFIKLVAPNGCPYETSIFVETDNVKHYIVPTIIDSLACSTATNGVISVNYSSPLPGAKLLLTYACDSTIVSVKQSDAVSLFNSLSTAPVTFTATDTVSRCASSLKFTMPVKQNQLAFRSNTWVPASCAIAANGVVHIEGQGGKPFHNGYDFTINTLPNITKRGISADFKGLALNRYTITLRDSAGCYIPMQDTVRVTGTPLSITNYTKTNPTCIGNEDGTIKPTITGINDTLTYTFKLGSLAGRYSPADNLPTVGKGEYDLYITASDGCSDSIMKISIDNPQPLNFESKEMLVKEFGGNDGYFQFEASGGSKHYEYSWTPLPETTIATLETIGETTLLKDNLPAGLYLFKLRDAAQCPYFNGSEWYTDTVSIVGPKSKLSIIADPTNLKCHNDTTGRLTLKGSGGWGADYLFSVDGSGFSPQKEYPTLSAGTYAITVRDSVGIEAQTTVTISQPDTLYLTSPVTKDATCQSSDNGWIKVKAAERNPLDKGLTYGIYTDTDSLMVQDSTSNTFYYGKLPKGAYRVMVNDSHGCKAYQSFNIDAPDAVKIATQQNIIRTKGDSTGVVTAQIINGSGQYNYRWSKNGTAVYLQDDATTGSILLNKQPAGSYLLEVRDTANCRYEGTEWMQRPITILEPETALKLLIAQSSVSCLGDSNGTVVLEATGGWGNYLFSKDNGDFTTETRYDSLVFGTYRFKVSDREEVTDSLTHHLLPPVPLSASLVKAENLKCHESGDGKITLAVSGGNNVFQVSVDSLNWHDGLVADSLDASTYSIYIRDANQCTAKAGPFSLSEPPPIINTSSLVLPSKCNEAKGSITNTFDGGTPPFRYKWTAYPPHVEMLIAKKTTPSLDSLFAARYHVMVTDKNNCQLEGKYVVDDNTSFAITDIATTPTTCSDKADGTATISVNTDQLRCTFDWPLEITNYTAHTANKIPMGSYVVMATDSQTGCKTKGSFNIGGPTAINYKLERLLNPLCLNGSKGEIDLTPTGGTPGYSFKWSNGATSAQIRQLDAGLHTVTITDKNGCQGSFNFPMAYLRTIKPQLGPDTKTCATKPVVLSGGNFNSFSWSASNGFKSSAKQISVNQSGTYVLQVQDADRCTGSDTITLDVSQLAIADVITTDISCNGKGDGTATLKVTPEAWPHSVWWKNGLATEAIGNLEAGEYSVSIWDSYGCNDTRTFTINEPKQLMMTAKLSDPLCQGVNDGYISLSAEGGKGGYRYNWKPGATGNKLSQLSPGSYAVTLMDANNCSINRSFDLKYQRSLSVELGSDRAICRGSNIKLYPGLFHSYQWTVNGQNAGSDTALIVAQQASVALTVKDVNGCSAGDNVQVAQTATDFAPLFLAASSVAAGDTLLLIEVSQPKPDDLQWSFNLPHKIIEKTGYACKVVFEREGRGEMVLTATHGDCTGESRKALLVLPKSESEGGSGSQSEQSSRFVSLVASPNPAQQHFTATVKLSEAAALTLYLVNIATGQVAETRKLNGLDAYSETFTPTGPGQFALFAESDGERRVVKVIVY